MGEHGNYSPEEHQEFVDGKRRRRMESIDRLPPQTRELVHDLGFYIVDQFLQNGVTKPKAIRHLVNVVLDEFSPTRGSFSQQGVRNRIHDDAALTRKSGDA